MGTSGMGGLNHAGAVAQAQGHGFLNQHMLAVTRCELHVFGMHLMGAGNVDPFHIGVSTHALSRLMCHTRKFLYKKLLGRSSGVKSRHQANSGVLSKSRQHEGKGPAHT